MYKIEDADLRQFHNQALVSTFVNIALIAKAASIVFFIIIFSIATLPANAAGKSKKPPEPVNILYLSKAYKEPPPLSLVEKIIKDKGEKGAEYSIRENNRVSQFVGYQFNLIKIILNEKADIRQVDLPEQTNLIIANLKADDLLHISQRQETKTKLIFNIRESNDELRGIKCRPNLYHIIPSWQMRADALAQYLNWKRWKKWFLIYGKSPIDQEYASAIKKAARIYRAKIVEERSYKFEAGSRRIESGHQQIQTQMPRLTQASPEHDVVFVADAAEAFGEYLLYRTEKPRPVVGSHGLIATAWHRSFEQFGGMSIQRSFEKFAKRIMSERDYTAWLAIKILAKTIIRINSQEPEKITTYLFSKKFKVAGFKGRGMTFRPWNRQLRQPLILSSPKALVSMSPQEGYLHPNFHTDTLGVDKPNNKCPFVS